MNSIYFHEFFTTFEFNFTKFLRLELNFNFTSFLRILNRIFISRIFSFTGRVVQDQVSGDVRYESRSEADIPLETLNLAEKDRFMNAEKDVAIISEAASSGISLQADRRVKNQVCNILQTSYFLKNSSYGKLLI